MVDSETERDVKELYRMVAELQRHYKNAAKVDEKLMQRIDRIEQYVELVAQKTGIPFTKTGKFEI